jgi:hypothetical protein
MTRSMQRLLSRVDGTPPLIAPTSILNVPTGAYEPSRGHRRPIACRRSDWMGSLRSEGDGAARHHGRPRSAQGS